MVVEGEKVGGAWWLSWSQSMLLKSFVGITFFTMHLCVLGREREKEVGREEELCVILSLASQLFACLDQEFELALIECWK